MSEIIIERPYLSTVAHRISSDAEAIQVAHTLAEQFREKASERDRKRILPIAELDAFSQSGLWAITIPKEYGGAGVSFRTVGEVIRIISAVDPSLGQLPQNHLVVVEHLILDASEAQKRFFFDLVLRGARFGNAFSEKGSRTVAEFATKITPDGDGYVVNGTKFFSTGALLAHWIPIVTVDEAGLPYLALAEQGTAGLQVVNDWSSFGQRTTASGTVIIDQVKVPREHVVPIYQAFARPTAGGPTSQFIQAAVDAGIAEGAIEAAIAYIRQHARPWIDDQHSKHASEDPYTIHQIGDLKLRLHAAIALLDRSAEKLQIASAEANEATVAAASIAVAEAKVLTTEIALLASNKLFELSGTRSTLEEYNLDRHWRNARTHTLHDPVRWKYHAIGNYYLNEVNPPRHPWL
ncbi:sulfur acquisition oxidoreductase, SfnB family [Methylobacillus rhizosphaerae]|uniref:Dibenzothiophene monooxygenase n=1 Tax=Methylobacillus rhizosphaerae TaxID=551994 RepID=A0A238ZK58_9PROT|nr:SfnB family sulfur acquisition oxidoreductase [Methylobacillus rhizosphaerae]SNR83757.1 sulfur acquisition oxidoreductase, SfnB family [Methylobacillus rhizosphaerae]